MLPIFLSWSELPDCSMLPLKSPLENVDELKGDRLSVLEVSSR